jgi:hypothetical protein
MDGVYWLPMDHKEAMNILQELVKKGTLTDSEKEAVTTAIGILSWTTLSKGTIKARKEKRDKSLEW